MLVERFGSKMKASKNRMIWMIASIIVGLIVILFISAPTITQRMGLHPESDSTSHVESDLNQKEPMEIKLFQEGTIKIDPMRLDFNSDGMIEKDEAKGPMKDVFDSLDLDKDGYIKQKELDLITELRSGEASVIYNNEEYTVFTLLDLNRDGILTHDEMRMLTEDEFAYLDDDSDGYLSEQELLELVQ